jgi:hypothetical protein
MEIKIPIQGKFNLVVKKFKDLNQEIIKSRTISNSNFLPFLEGIQKLDDRFS